MRSGSLAVALVLIAVGCADGAADTTADAAPPTTTPATSTTATPAAATTTSDSSTTTTLAETTTTAQAAATASFDAWIAVLASLPTGEFDQAAAAAEAKSLDAAAGVLLSDDYASLNPGFWVVYLGDYQSASEAEAACPGSAPDCYSRYLSGRAASAPIGVTTDTALALTDLGGLAVMSTVDGAVLHTLDSALGGDGSFPGPMSLGADGRSVYYSVGFEDYWFDCETSDGTLMQLVFGAGEPAKIGDGFSPAISPDGRWLIYLASSTCFPDPAEPQFVLAPIDTIVRRNLETGAEDRLTMPLTGDVAEGYELSSAAWGPDGGVYVLDTNSGLWHFAAGGSGNSWLANGEILAELEGGDKLVGYDATAQLLLAEFSDPTSDEPAKTLLGVDPASGAVVTRKEFPGEASFALDHTGLQLLVASEGRLESGERTVPVDITIWQIEW